MVFIRNNLRFPGNMEGVRCMCVFWIITSHRSKYCMMAWHFVTVFVVFYGGRKHNKEDELFIE